MTTIHAVLYPDSGIPMDEVVIILLNFLTVFK